MAYDKLVDSAQLDGALTATADAIRAKTSDTAPIAWDADNGFAAAVEGIEVTAGTIADGIVIKARDADGYPTEVDIYCSSGVFDNVVCGRADGGNRDTRFVKLEKINFKNSITQFKDQAFCVLSSLNTVTGVKSNPFEDVVSLGNWNTFNYCALPGELNFPNLTAAGVYSFYCMPNITKLSCPKLTYAHQYFAYNCESLKEIYLPSCTRVNGDGRYALGNNTALEKLEVGSVGHGVVEFKDIALYGCTQSFLTVTIYTTGSNADTMLANIRNSATNATIILKAAEDTTYNGTAYSAGDTIITSTVAITNLLDTIGYAENTRISTTDGGNRTATGVTTFGSAATLDKMIELSAGDVLRIKGVSFPAASDSVCCAAVYNDAATCTYSAYLHKGQTTYGEHFTVQFGEQITTITAPSGAATQHIRFTGICNDPASVVITKNQEI